jgi:hypothetical protein
MKVILVFNKFTDQYIGMTYGTEAMALAEENCDHTHFKYKTVDMDPETEVWEGNFTTGQIIPLAQQTTVISETELDADCQDKIFRQYRYYHQLNLVYGVLDQLIAAVALDEALLTDYRQMQTYIRKIVENNNRYKDAYAQQEGYEYLDKPSERDRLNAQLEGGLHEVMGRSTHPGTPQ